MAGSRPADGGSIPPGPIFESNKHLTEAYGGEQNTFEKENKNP